MSESRACMSATWRRSRQVRLARHGRSAEARPGGGKILLDAEMDAPVVAEILGAVDEGPIPATVEDLHVWRVGKGKYACVLSVSTTAEASADDFRAMLAVHEELAHVTVEINRPLAV